MVLSGTGDALGYKNGDWEFCLSGEKIHRDLEELGGLENISVNPKNWKVSDDTVMHLATADGLVTGKSGNHLFLEIAAQYIACFDDMAERAPGNTCEDGVRQLKPQRGKGYRIPFNPRGAGCGAAMRAMCIGLLYPRPEDIHKLIEVSVESGRMTHNHPTGYLGALASALFTAYSVQSKPIKEWGKGLVDTLPAAWKYVEDTDSLSKMLGKTHISVDRMVTIEERYVASMVLSGTGDALGYKNGNWEFCHSGEEIHQELEKLGGLDNISVNPKNWMVSDDTVMHLATADGLVTGKSGDQLFLEIAAQYIECFDHMTGRAPGFTCGDGVRCLIPQRGKGYRIPFNPRGGGCGAAMRAMCIGLLYPRPEDIHKLIEVSVESGRMTHNHPTGYLGALASALFTAYSVQSKPIKEWGKGLLDTLPNAWKYVEKTGVNVEQNKEHWDYFTDRWVEYLKTRNIEDGTSEPTFPEKYGIRERDAFYKSLSFSGWGGASGHDAPMIAYDALLSCNGTWNELCSRAMFHGGDSDSTGVIAGACYGAMFGFENVPERNYQRLEYKERLKTIAQKLLKLSHPEDYKDTSVGDIEECSTQDELPDSKPLSDETVEEQLQKCPDKGNLNREEGSSGIKRKSEKVQDTTQQEMGAKAQKPGET
ncbi:ADPRH-like protein [Mya arenaria]|uniref:ADP-ribosylhydrolase ARH1 n=1 Tax=Mya arenaria TaxID=6604 RepID=A0ABY7FE44_MYAAR|nr:ADPRH-like protein [Mya arenaria]